MKSILFIVYMICLIFTGQAAKNKQEVILSVGNKKFTKDEFIRIYDKNNVNLQSDSDKKSPAEYMELFINFQLKVLEAENLKMDTNRAFINELAGYRKELAAPYLTDISYTGKMVEEIYKRMTSEVSASHILFMVNQDAPASDTLAAYNKALKVREEIQNGLDFNEAAFRYSEDPTAKQNRGKLGYFSAFQMVYPFEEAAFTTQVGHLSMPFRTQFGFHLIKVEDLRMNRGEIRVAHIMKSFPPDASDDVKARAKKDLDEVFLKLVNGADFAEMAKQFSDDQRTAQSGGELPWFSSGRMITEFAEPAFGIKANGEFTQPVETPFGYHIIKRIDYRPVESFDKLKKEIENRLKSDPERSNSSKLAFVNKLKAEYNFTPYPENLKQFIEKAGSLFTEGKWNATAFSNFPAVMFKLKDKDYSGDRFAAFLKDQVFPQTVSDPGLELHRQFELWQEKEITDFEDSQLEMKYPEFADIMREYHDGILLFNISDEKIWSFAGKDSTGLEKYYENNKGKYLWDERFKGMIIRCRDMETRYEVDKYFGAGMNKQEVLSSANEKENKVTIEEGLWAKNDNPIVDFYVWQGPRFDGFNELLTFIRGDKTSPEPKKLDEARGLFIADYQKYLEDEWIKSLRKKYKFKVNQKLLKKVNDNRTK